jgi:hypothetical protein
LESSAIATSRIGQLSASPLPGKKFRAFATSARILGPMAWFVNEPADSAYPLPGIVRGGKESALACNFGQRTTRRQDRRTTEKHALQRRQAKALGRRWKPNTQRRFK